MDRFRKIQLKTTILFTVLITAVSVYIVVLMSGRSDYALRKNASSLIAASNRQMELNINSCLNRVEKTPSLLFSDEEYYDYDPDDTSADPYAQLKTEEDFGERIDDLGILDNYSDFGVVYRGDHIVGWLSKLTRGMYTDGGMYEDFAGILKDSGKSYAWVFGLNGNTDRIFYFKRYNDKAIIVLSFYSRELRNYFQIPEQLEGMSVSLVNEDDRIVYSNNDAKIGTKLENSTVRTIKDMKNGSVLTEDSLITADTCSNGWKVVCTLPDNLVIGDNQKTARNTLITVIFIVMLVLAAGINETRVLNESANSMVGVLQSEAQRDRMTGLYNKMQFETEASALLKKDIPRYQMGFIMLDIDNFKHINDTYGHIHGDEVIRAFAMCLAATFGSEFILGRLGGDEFGVFAHLDVKDQASMIKELETYQKKLREAVEKDPVFAEYQADRLSYSSGTAVVQQNQSFADIYAAADQLLYSSKKNGKGRDIFPEQRGE